MPLDTYLRIWIIMACVKTAIVASKESAGGQTGNVPIKQREGERGGRQKNGEQKEGKRTGSYLPADPECRLSRFPVSSSLRLPPTCADWPTRADFGKFWLAPNVWIHSTRESNKHCFRGVFCGQYPSSSEDRLDYWWWKTAEATNESLVLSHFSHSPL